MSAAVNKIISTGHYQLTTPQSPEDEKTFPVPGPMPVDNIQIEPRMQSNKQNTVSSTQKTRTGGESSGFIQSFDDNEERPGSNEESEEEETSKALMTATASTDKQTILPKTRRIIGERNKSRDKKQDEIVVHGKRYKLVSVESSDEASSSRSAESSEEGRPGERTINTTRTTAFNKSGTDEIEPADQLLPMVILGI